MITEDRKKEIARALEAYQTAHSLSQAKLAGIVGVSASYLSHISQANWHAVPSGGGKTTTISDATWQQLERALAMTGAGARVFETANYRAVIETLTMAKHTAGTTIIDGDTGAGKTFAIAEFQRKHPSGTFVVKCSNAMTAADFVRALADAVGLSMTGSRSKVLRAVAERLMREKFPLLIIDEAETIVKKPLAISYLKDLYDMVEERVGIVICGANGLLHKLKVKADYNVESFPQVLRRFGSDPTVLGGLTVEDAKLISSAFGVDDRAELARLRSQCPNVGHLCHTLRKRAALNAAIASTTSTATA